MYKELVVMIENVIDKKNLNASVYFEDDHSRVLVVTPRARAEIFGGKLEIISGTNTLSYRIPHHPEEIFKLFLKHFSDNMVTLFSKVANNSHSTCEITDIQFVNSMKLMMKTKGYFMTSGQRIKDVKGRLFKFHFYKDNNINVNPERLELVAQIPKKCINNSFKLKTRQIRKLNSNKVVSSGGSFFNASVPMAKLVLSGAGLKV